MEQKFKTPFLQWIKSLNEIPKERIKLAPGHYITDAEKFLETHMSIAKALMKKNKPDLAKKYIDRLNKFREFVESKNKEL